MKTGEDSTYKGQSNGRDHGLVLVNGDSFGLVLVLVVNVYRSSGIVQFPALCAHRRR